MKSSNLINRTKIILFTGLLLILTSCANELEEYWNNEIPTETYITDATASSTSILVGESVTFTDNSTEVLKRTWSFTGGSPTSSTEPSVVVNYTKAGTYKATLTLYHLDNLKNVISFDIVVN